MLQTEDQFVTTVDEVAPSERAQPDDGWHRMDIRFLLPKEVAGDAGVCLFRAVFEPGAQHERHHHPNCWEVFYVIRGRAGIGGGDDETVAERGTVQVVPPGKVHWLRNLDPDEPVEVVGAYLGVDSLESAGYEFVGPIGEEHRLAH